jgi:hypothetical protein
MSKRSRKRKVRQARKLVARWGPGPGVELPGLTRPAEPAEHVRRAAALVWYERRCGLAVADHNALQHHAWRLVEQLGEPYDSVRDDLVRASVTPSPAEAQKVALSLLLGA